MTNLMHALETLIDNDQEIVGVFTTPELAKEFAQSLEDEAMDDDHEEDVELEWRTGKDYTGDPCEFTEYDMSYTGTTYKVSLIRVDPAPWRKA